MTFIKGLINVMAPEIEDTDGALIEGLASLTWANSNRSLPAVQPTRPTSLVQIATTQREDIPPPPVPERAADRPGQTLRIQRTKQEHQVELERRIPTNPALSHKQTLSVPQHQTGHRRRATSPTDAEVSDFLRGTRPSLQRRETSPEADRGKPTIQEVASRIEFPAVYPNLRHPQPTRIAPDMAGTRRADYLDVTAASTPRVTPHQAFLKGQVQRQQDATDEWARRTGKPAPPYQFEDFIGKGAYGRVFKA